MFIIHRRVNKPAEGILKKNTNGNQNWFKTIQNAIQLKASEIYIPIMIYLRRLISQIFKACKCPDIKSRWILLSLLDQISNYMYANLRQNNQVYEIQKNSETSKI